MPHRVTELHSIMPIVNISSVMEKGILSHELAAELPHSDVSMNEIQKQREKVQVPGGQLLHEYANLYFDARNPMMSKLRDQAEALCVLSVSTDVLKLDGVVISDQNAASKYVRFRPASLLEELNFDLIYADDWRHPEDKVAQWQHKSAKCAEVLVPERIDAFYINKGYVVNESAKKCLLETGFLKLVEIKRRLFFQ